MDEEIAPPRRRRLTPFGKAARQKRIFARLREGWAYDEIAREERLTPKRVRQIVAEVLMRREVDDGSAHAHLQLARLQPLLKVAAEAAASGDVRAIPAALKVLDRLDRYQKAARVHRESGEEIRRKLLAKLNRMAEAQNERYGPEREVDAAPGEAECTQEKFRVGFVANP
ncbi:MAG TPA: hypothetical protein VMI72_10540 [Roseiarcus sp.]|nr:hypothetical protein [Roseiarcus sp.]